MPVLSHLRVSIENTTTKYKEFDDTRSLGRSTVNCVQTCLGVEHNQQFSIVLRPLPGFTWNGANGFIVTIDFDEGTQVRKFRLGVFHILPSSLYPLRSATRCRAERILRVPSSYSRKPHRPHRRREKGVFRPYRSSISVASILSLIMDLDQPVRGSPCQKVYPTSFTQKHGRIHGSVYWYYRFFSPA